MRWLSQLLCAYAAAMRATAEVELLAAHARRDAAVAWKSLRDK
jgi:hypothetical protein